MQIRRLVALGAATAAVFAAGLPVLATDAHAAGFAAPTGVTVTDLAPLGGNAPMHEPVISWTEMKDAPSYEVELSANSTFANNIALDAKSWSFTRYVLPQTLPAGTYWYRVRATGGAWYTGPSAIAYGWPVTPTASRASDGDISWPAITDADLYEVQVSTVGWGGQYQPNDKTVTCYTANTHFSPLKAVLDHGTPANGAVCEDMTKLTRSTVATSTTPATTSTIYWRVRPWDSSSAPAVPGADGSQSGDVCQGLPNNAIDKTIAGLCGRWTDDGSFVLPPAVANPSFGTPTLASISCPTGATGPTCTTTPTFTWTPPAGGADLYEVTIAVDPSNSDSSASDFKTVVGRYDTQFPSLTPRLALPANNAGYGYFVAVNACWGVQTPVCGDASNVQTFRVVDPAAATAGVAYDPQGDTSNKLHEHQVTLPFTRTAGAGQYVVEIASSNDPNYDNPIVTDTVDAPEATETVPDGDYIWRVRPVDGSSVSRNPESGTGFLVDTVNPVGKLATTALQPLGGAAIPVAFTKPVLGASASTVGLVPLHGGGSIVTGTWTAGGSSAYARSGRTAGAVTSGVFTPSRPLAAGESYGLYLSPSIVDAGGLPVVADPATVSTITTVDQAAAGVSKSAGWSAGRASDAYNGTYDYSATTGATESITVFGSTAIVRGCTGPTFGILNVVVDGRVAGKVSEYATGSHCNVPLVQIDLASFGTDAEHTIGLQVSGTHINGSKGNTVGTDVITVS